MPSLQNHLVGARRPHARLHQGRPQRSRRIQYANERFTSGKPGWRTDRGRIYIMFGQPADVETHTGGLYSRRSHEGGATTSVYPFERWTYRRIERIGDNVELEFVDKSMTGNYELALDSEEKDALLQVGWGPTLDELSGRMSRDQRIHFRFYGNPNNLDHSDSLFQYRRLQDEVWMRVQQFMKLEKPPVLKNPKLREAVTARLIHPDSLPIAWHYVFYRLNDSAYLVPIAVKIQNRDLSYTARENGRMSAKVQIYVRVTGLNGRVYYEFDDTIYSHYAAGELEGRSSHYSVYQKLLTLPAGRYRVDLLTQCDEGKRSSLVGFAIALPLLTDEVTLSPVTVSHYLSRVFGGSAVTGQFVIGDTKVIPAFDVPFNPAENLGVYLQGYGFGVDAASLRPGVKIRFQIKNKGGDLLRDFVDDGRCCTTYRGGSRIVVARHLSLTGLPPGKYVLQVTVEDGTSGRSQVASTPFEIAG